MTLARYSSQDRGDRTRKAQLNEDYLFVGGRPSRGVKPIYSRSLYTVEEHCLAEVKLSRVLAWLDLVM